MNAINKIASQMRGDKQTQAISHLPDVRAKYVALQSAEIGTVISLIVY
jgi:hypothetical protein